MRLSYLVKGLPGHPLHPPLTDATIGTYTVATSWGCSAPSASRRRTWRKGWWLALLVGVVLTGPTAVTGLIDWLGLTWGSELWKTATLHLGAMVTATIFFLVAVVVGHGGYVDGEVTGGALALNLIGFGMLTLGGWLGGTVVFVHGLRVLNLVEEPAGRAVSPVPKPEKEAAEGGGAPETSDRGLTRY